MLGGSGWLEAKFLLAERGIVFREFVISYLRPVPYPDAVAGSCRQLQLQLLQVADVIHVIDSRDSAVSQLHRACRVSPALGGDGAAIALSSQNHRHIGEGTTVTAAACGMCATITMT